MRKYSVFSLYVIEKKGHKFICECFFEDEYIEVLTREKIKVDKKEKVERLVEYYSILDRICLNSKKPLMLTKKNILLKYIEINEKEVEKSNKEVNKYIKEINKDINSIQDCKQNKLADNLINIWNDYVESVKDDIPNIPIVSAKELNKQKTLDKK